MSANLISTASKASASSNTLPPRIIQAPMAGVSTVSLAAAVSNAGGLGSLGLGHLSTAQAQSQIKELKAATNQPFNVNFFCHQPVAPYPAREQKWLELLQPYFAEFSASPPKQLHPSYQTALQNPELIAMLCHERPAIVSFHFGLPEPEALAALKQAGIKVWGCATNLYEAIALQQAGVDAMIAQGIEAGGHRGVFNSDPTEDKQIGLTALIPLLRQYIDLPLIAAGGIMNGAGIAAALHLGADAAQMGTAFILCPESAANESYRANIQSAKALETAITAVISGRPARGIKNRMHTEIAELQAYLPDYPVAYNAAKALHAAASQHNNQDFAAHWAGQGAPLARALPAADLVQLLKAELAVVLNQN